MRPFLFISISLLPVFAYSQNNLMIKGTAPLLENNTEIILSKILPGRYGKAEEMPIKAKIINHKFDFSIQATGSMLYVLSNGKGNTRLFLSPGKANVIVKDSIVRKVSFIDNPTALDYEKYEALLDSIKLFDTYGRARVDYTIYTRKYPHIDTALANAKMRRRDSLLILLNKQMLATGLDWIKQHPNSPINSSVLYNQIGYMPEGDFKKAFFSLPVSQKNDVWGKESKYRIDSLFIGGTAPSVVEKNVNGKTVTLSDFRGKYVLLDFWAAWCIPCREENPNVVKAAKKYKNYNFTVLGISVDDSKEAWLKAIEKDGLEWTHLSALKGWENGVSKKYYISSIPSNYLIGPDGKIIAKDIRGKELNKTLEKTLTPQ